MIENWCIYMDEYHLHLGESLNRKEGLLHHNRNIMFSFISS